MPKSILGTTITCLRTKPEIGCEYNVTYDYSSVARSHLSREKVSAEPKTHQQTIAGFTTTELSHFKLLEMLGCGGMGEVYRAIDLTLERYVALKMIKSSDLITSNTGQTLLEEARLACKLNHPNIVTIYDITRGLEETSNSERPDTTNFIVMEWVDGKTLEKSIPDNGFSLEIALKYACQISEALAFAHKQNIIHRDIKPGNLMISKDGKIKILDFGIARLHQRHREADGTQPSPFGLSENNTKNYSMGTPAYMAPEQVNLELVDERSDIFSFGMLFYEMLTGHDPFKNPPIYCKQSEFEAQKKNAIQKLKSDIPLEIVSIVDKMLAFSPTSRYQTSDQLKNEFHALYEAIASNKNWWQRRSWLPKSAVLLPIILILSWSLHSVVFPPTTQQLVQRQINEASKIALLPFDNISGDPLLQAFIDGLTVNLNSDLTTAAYEQKEAPAWIIPPNEIRKLGTPNVQLIHKKYAVDLVLTGSIQNLGTNQSIHLNLMDASDGRQLATREVLVDSNMLFEGEHAIREQLLGLLNWQLSPETVSFFDSRKPKFDSAYRHYIEGKGYLYRQDIQGNLEKARIAFQTVIKNAPLFEDAYVENALVQLTMYKSNKSDVFWLTEMRKTIDRLAQINPQNHNVSYLTAELAMQEGDYEKALHHYKNCISENNKHLRAINGAARALEKMGNIDESRLLREQAKEQAPNNWTLMASYGLFFLRNGLYQEALQEFGHINQVTPDNDYGYRSLAVIHYKLGNFQEAIRHTHQAIELKPTASAYNNLGTMQFYLGDYQKATAAYEQAVKLNDGHYLYWGNLADGYKLTKNQKAQSTFIHAAALVDKKLAINPRDYTAIARAAYYHSNLNNTERALALASTIGNAHSGVDNINAAYTYDQLGLIDKAIEHIRIALTKNYPLEDIKASPLLAQSKTSDAWADMVCPDQKNC
jgi:serine/threonine protein kinase/Flp pilus assembly protein TadD